MHTKFGLGNFLDSVHFRNR